MLVRITASEKVHYTKTVEMTDEQFREASCGVVISDLLLLGLGKDDITDSDGIEDVDIRKVEND